MNTEKSMRRAAIDAAKNAIMERAKTEPNRFTEGLLMNPSLLHGVSNLDEIFNTLLEKGMRDKLMLLATAGNIPSYARILLASKLL